MSETRVDTRFDADPVPLAEARTLLRAHPAVDLHCDTVDRALRGVDLFEREPGGAHAGPPRLVEGGVGAAVYVLWIPPHLGRERGWAHLARMVDRLERTRIRLEGPLAALELVPALEDARVLIGDGTDRAMHERVQQLAAWGMRYVTPTWNTGNLWATSCEDTRRGVGLTPRGRDLVRALDGAGIRVDVSHLSDVAAAEVLELAGRPPIASHSSARAVCPHRRNLTDDLARRVAGRGGIIGVNVHRPFVAIVPGDATIARVVDHVEHLWRVAGDEAVAIGSDFDGIPIGPRGLEHAGRLPHLIAALLVRGHSAGRLARFAGDNARRRLGIGLQGAAA